MPSLASRLGAAQGPRAPRQVGTGQPRGWQPSLLACRIDPLLNGTSLPSNRH